MPVITPDESGSNRFRAKCIKQRHRTSRGYPYKATAANDVATGFGQADGEAGVTPLGQCIAQQKQGEPIYRAICKDCDWDYEGSKGTHQLIVFAHAAGHSYKGDHEIRFETVYADSKETTR